MSNPVTPYLLPVLIGLMVLSLVLIVAHKWDAGRDRRGRGGKALP